VLKFYDACNRQTAIRCMDDVLRRLPFRVLAVQTDNGAEVQSQFSLALGKNVTFATCTFGRAHGT
jgi:hypothetical protein